MALWQAILYLYLTLNLSAALILLYLYIKTVHTGDNLW